MCETENSLESKKGLKFVINNKTRFFCTFGTCETQQQATHVIPEPCSGYLAKLSVCKAYKNAMLVYKKRGTVKSILNETYQQKTDSPKNRAHTNMLQYRLKTSRHKGLAQIRVTPQKQDPTKQLKKKKGSVTSSSVVQLLQQHCLHWGRQSTIDALIKIRRFKAREKKKLTN